MTQEQLTVMFPLIVDWLHAIDRFEQAVIDIQWMRAEPESKHQVIKDEYKAAQANLTLAAAMFFTHPDVCEDIRKNVNLYVERISHHDQ